MRLRKKWMLLWLLFPLCAEAKTLEIVASFSILADMAQQVAGDGAQVSSIIPAGSDPHNYQPTPQDIQRISHADIILINGLGLERGLDALLQNRSGKGALVVVSRDITPRKLSETEPDPHAWQDVANAKHYVRVIEEALEQADPTHKSEFEANAGKYLEELGGLDTWIRKQVAAIPEARRKVISSHDAFGYFSEVYGIKFVPAQGVNPDSELSAGAVAALVRQIRESGINILFLEENSDSRLLNTLVEETHAVVGGKLQADSLTQDGEGSTYLSMMRRNVNSLTNALQK